MQRGRTISEHPTVESNPFTLPSDEEVFRMRETEKQRKEEEKSKNSRLKIYDKTTASSKIGNIRRFRSDDAPTGLDNYSVSQSRRTRGLVAAATATISNDRLREKENMADFIAKKREMFLVQMSLDTKREEIRKLEEKAQLKEEALKKSELMLEEDAVRFDTFLKENDKKAHEAIKRAEKETKAKADKVQEIKKLNQQIQLVQSDMSKLSEQLQDCLQYKAFLDELTPQEYEMEQRDKKRARQMARLQKRKDKILREWELQKAKALAEIEERERAEKERPDSKNGKKKADKTVKVKEIVVPLMPNLDNMPLTSSGEEIPMYFQNPQQLLDIFTALEESNLFLIQNSQETEQTLEELKQNYRETKKTMDRKTQALKTNVDGLQQQISTEESKASQLRLRSQGGTGENAQERMLKELQDRVLEVYKRCGFEAETNSSTLYMLTDLEARLEDLLSAIEQMPEDYVAKAEKEKEKERRERVRQERIAQQQKMYEERMKKSMERSMQAPKKRKGRQVMWRSQPARHIKHAEDDNKVDQGDEADHHHFIW
ncbi:Cilia- and flagella-associated protein [Phytophthora fragariae]|uniref:Cilia-and flagella-associated protein n=1 Tax=Phytophthora fragariae TaxID=53985 RepID=A0A6A3ENZ7_9STRA|nr:Cilia- and flagella-associated protein [Phytophthora fragariae]KAE8934253.1 Cilia- and flagella-associated protein [Phytophthora fragariae]KAE9140077.1 Cilia- and flagella-associated protein [Phytophthora fragariae]KAE9225023.1 Cilia- and flagella-associated protein [Phytophthora fragariae]KAE9302706.1 Cilia- and flagella-associated protein [Phytophthora fragariae]